MPQAPPGLQASKAPCPNAPNAPGPPRPKAPGPPRPSSSSLSSSSSVRRRPSSSSVVRRPSSVHVLHVKYHLCIRGDSKVASLFRITVGGNCKSNPHHAACLTLALLCVSHCWGRLRNQAVTACATTTVGAGCATTTTFGSAATALPTTAGGCCPTAWPTTIPPTGACPRTPLFCLSFSGPQQGKAVPQPIAEAVIPNTQESQPQPQQYASTTPSAVNPSLKLFSSSSEQPSAHLEQTSFAVPSAAPAEPIHGMARHRMPTNHPMDHHHHYPSKCDPRR